MTLEEIKTEALRYGYILRRVGHKREKIALHDGYGGLKRNCYIPHIPCDARTFAHTHRTFANLRKWEELVRGQAVPTYADMWPTVLAIIDEKLRAVQGAFGKEVRHAEKH